jgi:hypothetical protein
MNKDLLNSLPAEDQPVASQLNSLVNELPLSRSFQDELEMKLIDAARKTKPEHGWQAKMFPALAWTALALGAVLILNLTVRSMSSTAPGTIAAPDPMPSFQENVRQGGICADPLAAGHGFAVSITNDDKTGFIPLDEANTIPEMRSFAWAADGSRLALVTNSRGQGNVYLMDSSNSLQPVIRNSELGYLMDGAWSRDGKQFVLWSLQDNKLIYILNADGSDLVEKKLDVQILGTPQFAPDGKSIIFYGADQNAAGLLELNLDSSQIKLINGSVKDPGGYAFSPDGSLLAYLEYDRDNGEARLLTSDIKTGERRILGTWPISKNSGSSLPESANLNWSGDGKFITLDMGQGAYDRVMYLALTDGTGLIKVANPGYAPAISPDGKCLAYIQDNRVFLLDLNDVLSAPTAVTPLFLAELPGGRGAANYKLDKLQWRP